jgi:hypothetical protein
MMDASNPRFDAILIDSRIGDLACAAPGLYLSGPDVGGAGITGAMMVSVLSAAAIEPQLLSHLA